MIVTQSSSLIEVFRIAELGRTSLRFLHIIWFFYQKRENIILSLFSLLQFIPTSLVAQLVKNLPAVQETQVQFLCREDPLEKEMVIHSSILAWIPWTEEHSLFFTIYYTLLHIISVQPKFYVISTKIFLQLFFSYFPIVFFSLLFFFTIYYTLLHIISVQPKFYVISTKIFLGLFFSIFPIFFFSLSLFFTIYYTLLHIISVQPKFYVILTKIFLGLFLSYFSIFFFVLKWKLFLICQLIYYLAFLIQRPCFPVLYHLMYYFLKPVQICSSLNSITLYLTRPNVCWEESHMSYLLINTRSKILHWLTSVIFWNFKMSFKFGPKNNITLCLYIT